MRLLIALIVSSLLSVCWSADFPQWRGPQRDGSVAGLDVPASWPDKLTRRWQVPVGEGHSCPVVSGGRIFQHSREGEQEVLRAIDPASGKVLWRQAYDAPYTMNPAARGHGKGPKSTPVVAGGRVCTLGISGILACFSAESGELLWRKSYDAEFDQTSPLFGTAMSPLVDNDTLIAHVGGHGGGALRAFEAANGETKWNWSGDGPGYASPVIAELDGARQLVTQTESKIVALSLESGELLWEIPFTTRSTQNIVTPISYRDTLILSGLGNPTMAVRPRRQGGGWTTDTLWRSDESSMYMTSPVLVGDLLFGFTNRNSGQLFCLNAATGEIHWTGPPRSGRNAALLVTGDTLLSLTDEAKLAVIRATAGQYEPIKEYTVADSPTWAHPVPCGDGLLIKDETSLAFWSW